MLEKPKKERRRPLKFPHYLAFSRTISLFSALFPALFGKIFRTIFHFFPHSTRSPEIRNIHVRHLYDLQRNRLSYDVCYIILKLYEQVNGTM